MDYDQLTSFLEIAKLQSFSRAAEKIYRTQPAISAQVRLLEQECGERLFDRSGKRVLLTPAGEILQRYAQRIIELHKEALQTIAELNQTARGKLHIGANEATCLYVLPKTFARFKELYPLVQVVTPSNHPLAKKRSVTVGEVANYPLILPKTGHTRVVLDRVLRDYRDHIQPSMELASVEMIKKFVGAGLGISLISRTYAEPEVAAGLLKLIPLEDHKLYRELGLIYRRDRYLSLPAKVFIEVVRESTKSANSCSNSTTKTHAVH